MKYLLLLISFLSFQTDNLSVVVDTEGKSQDELFSQGKEWLFRTYKNGKVVMEFEDRPTGKILGSAITQTVYYKNLINVDAGHFSYNLELGFKDGKSRLVIDDIYYVDGEMMLEGGASFFEDFPSNWPQKNLTRKKNEKEWNSMKAQAAIEFQTIIESFKTHMSGSSKESDDW